MYKTEFVDEAVRGLRSIVCVLRLGSR